MEKTIIHQLDAHPALQNEIQRRKKAEEALQESEARFRELVEETDVLIAKLDGTGNFTYVNHVAEKIFGVGMEQCIGRSMFEFVHAEDRDTAVNDFQGWIHNQVRNVNCEIRQINFSTNAIHHMLWAINFRYDKNRQLTGINSFARDLTERKKAEENLRKAHAKLEQHVHERTIELLQANDQLKKEIEDRNRVEKALRESEERYRALFENNPIETVIVDKDLRITGYNLAKGQSSSRLPNIGDIMYKDYAGKHQIDMLHELNECIKSGIPKEFTDQAYFGRFLHIRISPFPGGAIITSIDITYRKRVEEALRESEKRYRTLVETIPHGIQEISTRGVITFANSALYHIFGYERGELIGKPLFDLLVSEKEQQEMKDFLATLVREQPTRIPFLNKCLTKDGRIIDIQSDWNYKKDKKGNLIGFISIITDITNRLLAEEDKIRLEKKLHHVQKMEAIGTLAGGIAHDFNNILGSILLNTELAIDDLKEDSSALYSLKQVLKGSHRAKDLVEQILTFSRESEIERKPIRIHSIVKETLRMLRAMLPATIIIQQDIAEDVGVILADITQIQQLVLNLCNNAAHAMIAEGGKLKVELENVFINEPPVGMDMIPGRYVRLSVSDMGCGMKPEIKDRIFDPFFTTKRPGEGTGLGLSVVHGIVIHHDGMITVESEEGKGSTFDIYLPIIPDDKSSNLIPSTLVQPPTGNEDILFVDDEEVVVDANRRTLQRLGYNVTVFTNSKKALSAFKKNPQKFDLVITDMTMPGMTGAELARELIRIRPDIPIILCTGYSQLITPEKSNAIGIQEFVMKPFSRDEIADVIRKVLDKNRS